MSSQSIHFLSLPPSLCFLFFRTRHSIFFLIYLPIYEFVNREASIVHNKKKGIHRKTQKQDYKIIEYKITKHRNCKYIELKKKPNTCFIARTFITFAFGLISLTLHNFQKLGRFHLNVKTPPGLLRDKHIFKLPAASLRCETCETAALSSVESVAMSASVQI
jgi:hypothetical protein